MVVLGVDGGTTKTIAMVADDQGHILSAARGGGSNWSGEDVEIPMSVVVNVVSEALGKISIDGSQVDIGVFTLAGADWPEDHERRARVLGAASICRKVIVKNDSFGGLRAGTNKPYGMVIAAGTGMNAAVISPQGLEWAFGYYETFGGARTLAQDAFEAVLRAEDGRGQPTLLTEMVLRKLCFPSVEAMLRAYISRKIDIRLFLSLPPLIFEAALKNDAVASSILIRQGKGLAEYVTAMVNKYKMTHLEFDVVLAGSIFKGVGPLLIDTIRSEVRKVAPQANVIRSNFEPVVGSVLLAYDSAGIKVTEEMYLNLRSTMPDDTFFATKDNHELTPGLLDEE